MLKLVFLRCLFFFYLQVMHDIGSLVTELNGNYLEHVLQLLTSCPTEVLGIVKQSILQGAKSLKDLIPIIMDTMIEALVEKSVEVSSLIV